MRSILGIKLKPFLLHFTAFPMHEKSCSAPEKIHAMEMTIT